MLGCRTSQAMIGLLYELRYILAMHWGLLNTKHAPSSIYNRAIRGREGCVVTPFICQAPLVIDSASIDTVVTAVLHTMVDKTASVQGQGLSFVRR